MKKIIISLILISLILCDDTCTTKSETECNSDSTCEWKSAYCSGGTDTTCTSITVESTCGTTQYTVSKNCVFTAEVPSSCTGTPTLCTAKAVAACTEIAGCSANSGGTACEATCSSQASSDTNCEALGCTFTQGSNAKCEGDTETCGNKGSSNCASTQYNEKINCSWNSASCVAKSNSEDEKSSDKGSSQFNKLSLVAFTILNFIF